MTSSVPSPLGDGRAADATAAAALATGAWGELGAQDARNHERDSIPPAAPGQPLGAAEPSGEREQSWGRGVVRVDNSSGDVTPGLPVLNRVARPGDISLREPDNCPHVADSAAAQRARLLARIREIGEWPPPAEPAHRARPGEMPSAAMTVRNAAVDPWRTACWYAPCGSVPYYWERRAAGYLATAIAYVRFAHPDGRAAVGVWVRDQLAEQKWPRQRRGKIWSPVACQTCAVKGPAPWALAWSFAEGWRWRTGPDGTFPAPIGAVALKAAVADPTWRATPYAIEEAA